MARNLDTENPRLRSSVSMLGQRIVVPLKRFVAPRLREQMLIRALGLEREVVSAVGIDA